MHDPRADHDDRGRARPARARRAAVDAAPVAPPPGEEEQRDDERRARTRRRPSSTRRALRCRSPGGSWARAHPARPRTPRGAGTQRRRPTSNRRFWPPPVGSCGRHLPPSEYPSYVAEKTASPVSATRRSTSGHAVVSTRISSPPSGSGSHLPAGRERHDLVGRFAVVVHRVPVRVAVEETRRAAPRAAPRRAPARSARAAGRGRRRSPRRSSPRRSARRRARAARARPVAIRLEDGDAELVRLVAPVRAELRRERLLECVLRDERQARAGRGAAAAVVVLPAPGGPVTTTRRDSRRSEGSEEPQDVREDPAVPEVLALARRVETDAGAELLVVGAHRHLVRLAVLDAVDRERLTCRSGRASRASRRPGTAAAARPSSAGSSGGCARTTRAITALTPSRFGPFAAQSRDEPEPYSLPAITIVGVPSSR